MAETTQEIKMNYLCEEVGISFDFNTSTLTSANGNLLSFLNT